MLSFEVFSNTTLEQVELWLLSIGSQVMTHLYVFWWFQFLTYSHALHILKLNSVISVLCMYDAFTAWLIICLMSLSQWSYIHSTSASTLRKSNCRPCQDCYLHPSLNPLWSSPLFFPAYSLCWLLVPMTLQGTSTVWGLFVQISFRLRTEVDLPLLQINCFTPLINWSFYLSTIACTSLSSFAFFVA